MLENKMLVNLYVLVLDKNFEVFVPIDEKVGNIVNLLNRSLINLTDKKYAILNLYSGVVYKNNDIVRNTDIKNGTKLILI